MSEQRSLFSSATHINPNGKQVTVAVGRNVKIGDNVTIGSNVTLHNMVTIGNDSIIGDDVVIGTSSRISEGVRIWDKCRIGPMANVFAYAVLFEGAMLGTCTYVAAHAEVAHWTIVPDRYIVTGLPSDHVTFMVPATYQEVKHATPS